MSKNKAILVTGGAGYIGSHTVVELLSQTENPIVIFDNFSNASNKVLERIRQLGGRDVVCEQGDLRQVEDLQRVFEDYQFDAVIHFAGLKAVGESVAQPMLYYSNNVIGSLNLFRVMAEHDCTKLVFSSSATVYGDPEEVPISESARLQTMNPYGQSKLMIEEILSDLSVSDPRWQVAVLRYFNPIAAHESGLIGEEPKGIPNNLLPYIAQVAVGRRERLTIHGDDYDTPDGTGVRDYIHVVDLAQAHLAALDHLSPEVGWRAFNIGTGQGYSVLEMTQAFQQISGKDIPYTIGPRRPGDIATCYANPSRAKTELNWSATRGLKEMITDHWRWQSQNPNGY